MNAPHARLKNYQTSFLRTLENHPALIDGVINEMAEKLTRLESEQLTTRRILDAAQDLLADATAALESKQNIDSRVALKRTVEQLEAILGPRRD